jgi:hypothetical protein
MNRHQRRASARQLPGANRYTPEQKAKEIRALQKSSWLADRLVAEYLAAKDDVLRGQKAVESFTDREEAGMFLRVFGRDALAKLDELSVLAKGNHLEETFPSLRALLVEALSPQAKVS